MESKKEMLIEVIAHRGNSGTNCFTDNSYDGFIDSISYPDVAGIEMDGRGTSNGDIVLSHEKKLANITPRQLRLKGVINSFTYEELEKYKVSNHQNRESGMYLRTFLHNRYDGKLIRRIISEKKKKFTNICRANTVLDELVKQGYKGQILFDYKEDDDHSQAAVIELLNTYKDRLHFIVEGRFGKRVTTISKQTGISGGVIVDFNNLSLLKAKNINESEFTFYSIIWTLATPDNIKKLIRADKQLYTWTDDSIYHILYVLRNLVLVKRKYGLVPDKVVFITNFPTIIASYINGKTLDLRLLRILKGYLDELDGKLVEQPKILLPKQPNR